MLRRKVDGEITVFPLKPKIYDLDRADHKGPKRLYCKNGGYLLRILPNGVVNGSRQETDIYTLLKIKAVSPGVVVIQGVETGHFLAMDKGGHVYATLTLKDECYFVEKLEENNYNTYRAQWNQEKNWYLGIKKNGEMKNGSNTHKGQNAILFLPLPVDGSI
ncbi:fibroblast growth factor 1b [Chanos chanos]|uniref:Fibroblast growth factor n=1 Tax=Chanos chanos TaxID=29144 RepID=A0A6J2X008_CHACN|nr:fibroblast growth factor 1 [Chanos chanos]